MTLSVWLQAVGVLTGVALAFYLISLTIRGTLALLERKPRKQELPVPHMHWQAMPSGWTKSYGPLIGYAIFDGQHYYWWLQRNHKTIIEGPARTLELAQYEVEAAASEFRREA